MDSTMEKGILAFTVVGMLLAGAEAKADVQSVEPNDSCRRAQHIGFVGTSTRILGRLGADSPIDFFAFDGTPGDIVSVTLLYDPVSGSTVWEDGEFRVLGGAFDSTCRLLVTSDKLDATEPFGWVPWASFKFRVPDDGRFVIAYTNADDHDFSGVDPVRSGEPMETYTTVSIYSGVPRTLSGRVVETGTGEGLSGGPKNYSSVQLYTCESTYGPDPDKVECASGVKLQTVFPDNDGYFEIVWGSYSGQNYYDSPIYDGNPYLLKVWASGYEPYVQVPLEVPLETTIDRGDIRLYPQVNPVTAGRPGRRP